MILKVVYKQAGGHVFMRMWVGMAPGGLALAGQLTMTDEEFMNYRKILEACSGFMDTIIFEQQTTSSPAIRENNGFHPA